ncbi:MAG: outer membrane beta-barrel protein [Saprospiraceae bacterium]|nr:outer membrane beta-barrel protein [Saprospiraceae bacterium]
MKIFTLNIICLLLMTGTVSAQKNRPIDISPKLGVNFNDFIIDESSSVISLARMGWNLGADINYGYRLQAKGGVHFYRLGTGIERNDANGSTTERVITSQFKFPLGASYKVWNVDYFNLWVQSQLVVNLTTRMIQTEAETQNEIYPRSGFSGRVGVGMDISRIIIEFNYERSFTNMIKQSFDAQSKIINLSLGFKF